jgi:small-conductance mechanosensitive channel
MADETAAGFLAGRLDALREHIAALAGAAPRLAEEFSRVSEQLAREMAERGQGVLLGLTVLLVAIGFALEGVFRWFVREKPRERLPAIGLRFAREAGAVAAFTLGATAALLVFDWPAQTRDALIAFFIAFIGLRAAMVASRALFSPADARLRIVPVDDAGARFWHLRIALLAGWLGFGWMIVDRLGALGMSLPARQIVAYVFGLGLLAIAIEAFWRRSRASAILFAALWALWVLKAMGAFWLVLLGFALLPVLRLTQAAVDHVLHPGGEARGVLAAALGRGLRAAAIIGAAILLVRAFNLDFEALSSAESFWPRLARGAVQALAIVLLADLAWLVAASLIDRKLARDAGNARLQTLLPIVRGTLAAVLVVMTVLMGLSALGVQVGPLIAGAGVVGVAVGFGSQTLVRDLFAKFTYLMDDAFRVGEYIESGSFKGTVENLGGRSVRLRHHRGPIFTIPYGQLGAVKNSSRDWVIDKMTLGVTYDTDLDKAKKLIKKIGQKLAEDPEFAPKILEPLKMQGVEQFGEYAIQIRIKMKTVPNEQFAIRRRAYAMIKQAFDANGIHFAFPTVQVAGGGDAAAAVASAEVRALKAAQSQE